MPMSLTGTKLERPNLQISLSNKRCCYCRSLPVSFYREVEYFHLYQELSYRIAALSLFISLKLSKFSHGITEKKCNREDEEAFF